MSDWKKIEQPVASPSIDKASKAGKATAVRNGSAKGGPGNISAKDHRPADQPAPENQIDQAEAFDEQAVDLATHEREPEPPQGRTPTVEQRSKISAAKIDAVADHENVPLSITAKKMPEEPLPNFLGPSSLFPPNAAEPTPSADKETQECPSDRERTIEEIGTDDEASVSSEPAASSFPFKEKGPFRRRLADKPAASMPTNRSRKGKGRRLPNRRSVDADETDTKAAGAPADAFIAVLPENQGSDQSLKDTRDGKESRVLFQQAPAKKSAKAAPRNLSRREKASSVPLENEYGGPAALSAEAAGISAAKRYNQRRKRRGHYAFAAPLGLCILLLSAIGLFALLFWGIRGVLSLHGKEALKEELGAFLAPVALYTPQPFEDINEQSQDAFLLAALWRLTNAEALRQEQQPAPPPRYTQDPLGRFVIPLSEVAVSYAELFGEHAQPRYRTIGQPGTPTAYEYSLTGNCYYVPTGNPLRSNYTAVVDRVQKDGDLYRVRIGYVPNSEIEADAQGNCPIPSAKQAAYFQIFIVKKTASGQYLTAIAPDGKEST